MGRLAELLSADEVPGPLPPASTRVVGAIEATGAALCWGDGADTPALVGVDLALQGRSLAMVVGPVGGGKSLLLSALIGDAKVQKLSRNILMVKVVSGALRISGRIGFMPQHAWVLNATIRQNVVMHAPWDPERFSAVLRSCELEEDVAALPAGDLTEVRIPEQSRIIISDW